MANAEPIPIVGGGIAGLTLALSLAHRAISCEIHEKAEQFEEVGAGIQVSPNAMSILSKLGLEKAIKARGVEPDHIELYAGKSGARLAQLPVAQASRERYGAPYVVMHRADLQAILVEACRQWPHIALKTGSTIEPQEVDTLLIAADGVHSAWAPLVAEQASKEFTGYVAWRITVPTIEETQTQTVRVWMGANAHIVDYPIRAGAERNIVVLASANDPRPIRADPAKTLQKALSGWHAPLRQSLGAHEGWTPWPLYARDPKHAWVSDRIALIGDAAHAMLPFLAQGAAMAIEDAWVLAQMLESSAQSDQALARYQAARQKRVARVWQNAASNGQIYHLTGPFAWARNAYITTQSGASLLARYDWLYRWRASET